MEAPLAGGSLVYYRTRAKQEDGYGYFVIFKYKDIPPEAKGQRGMAEDLIELKALPFLRKKLAEITRGTRASEELVLEKHKYRVFFEGDKIKWWSYKIGSMDFWRYAYFTVEELRKFVSLMEVLALLKKPKGEEEYDRFVKELMSWATAKRVHAECNKQKPGTMYEDDFRCLWDGVVAQRYTEFLDCLESFATVIKNRLGIRLENVISYDDKFQYMGHMYSKRVHEYETAQLLVHILHESEFVTGRPCIEDATL